MSQSASRSPIQLARAHGLRSEQEVASRPQHTVALVNPSVDTSEMLRCALEGSRFRTVSLVPPASSDGTAQILAFLQRHVPDVVLYDIPPPYDLSWSVLMRVCSHWDAGACSIIVTTTNRARVEELACAMPVHAVLDRLYEVQEVVRMVANACSPARSTPGRARRADPESDQFGAILE
jgi:DNA-binding NtrC family response regulator